jgi:hypothetical protein
MKIGIGLGLPMPLWKSGALPTTYYFVRPTGTSYGTGDGLSYANAWSGFPAVNQAAVVAAFNAELAICGEHRQTLTVSVNNLKIKGNHASETGWINGQSTRSTGIDVNAKTGIEIVGLAVTHHTTQNLMLQGNNWSITTRFCNFSNCGNQGIQNLGTGGLATHEDPTINDCLDEAISMHEASTINIHRGQFRNNGTSGAASGSGFCNIIGGTLNLYDIYDTSGNGLGGKIDLDIGNSIASPIAVCNVYNCRLNGLALTAWGEINLYDSYLFMSPNVGASGNLADNKVGTLRFRRCTVDGSGLSGTAAGLFDFQSGSRVLASHTIFRGMPSGKYALMIRTGTTVESINNCAFYGGNGTPTGIALFTQFAFTVTNCIFRGLGSVDVGAFATYRYCSFTNNTSGPLGTQVSSVNSNPLWVDAPNNDFSLSPGSPMIGAGEVVAEATGIVSANWGSVSAAPVIVSGAATSPPNIGPFV